MAKKQKDGRYRARIKIGVDNDGNAVYKYLSARSKRELDAARIAAVEFYVNGKSGSTDVLFGVYAVDWFNNVKSPTISDSSRENYRTALNRDILPVFGDRNIRAISTNDLQAFINGFTGKSATKITTVIAALRGVFSAAVADRIIDINPVDALRKPAHSRPAEKRALAEAERERVASVCRSHPYGHYLALMYYLGIRPGEARGLEWGDIDFASSVVHIQRDYDYKSGKIGELKTVKSNRRIPLPPQLRSILLPLIDEPDALVVRGEKGGALAKTSAERIWCDLMAAAGMTVPSNNPAYPPHDPRRTQTPLITPHALRHNYATMCWEHGIDIYTAQKLLGHSSIKTTMDVYTHISDAHLSSVASQVAEMFSPAPTPAKTLPKGCRTSTALRNQKQETPPNA